MIKKILELRTGDNFTGEGVGDDFSCAEFPRLVPRINVENAGPHVFSPGAAIPLQVEPAASTGEPRKLRVSVWCGFAHILADVTVEPGTTMPVTIDAAFVDHRSTHHLTSPTLDRIGVKRASGFASLREAIEARAREEAFA